MAAASAGRIRFICCASSAYSYPPSSFLDRRIFFRGGIKKRISFPALKVREIVFFSILSFFHTNLDFRGKKNIFPPSRFFEGGSVGHFFRTPPLKKNFQRCSFSSYTYARSFAKKNISKRKIFPSWVGHFHFLFWNLGAILPRPSASLPPFFSCRLTRFSQFFSFEEY